VRLLTSRIEAPIGDAIRDNLSRVSCTAKTPIGSKPVTKRLSNPEMP